MNSASESAVITQLCDSLGIIRFSRPSERNALSTAVLLSVQESLDYFLQLGNLHGIIFTGTDDVFASGADIRELTKLDSISAQQFSKFGQGLFQKIADLEITTLAAINGYCIGGALDLALACDIRIASQGASFAHPGARLGIITGWGGTQRLPELIGRSRALEFFCTARRISSSEALKMGLISEIADPVLERAVELLRDL